MNSEDAADGLPSVKDLKNLRDEKKAAASIDKGNRALEDFQEAGTQNEILGNFVHEAQQEVDQLDQEIEVSNSLLRQTFMFGREVSYPKWGSLVTRYSKSYQIN